MERLEKNGKMEETEMNCIKEKKQRLLSLFQQGHNSVLQQRTEIRQKAIELGNLLIEKISPLYIQFKEHGRKCSALFAFWNEYMEMVWLLLNFIHGDRDASWLLHLETFRAMLPYDRAFHHLNYFRWGTVYLTDMKMLQEVAPTVHRDFTENRAHAVSTSSFVSSFNSVSPDMALEQTVNRDSKTKGGIVGVTGMEGTRDRWALTAHMMAAATASFKVMSGTSASSSCHKELGSQRIERDENDVNNIIQCIETKLVNPFDISQYEGEKMPLINIATGTVVSSEVSESLLSAKEQGEKAMGKFVQARLISDKENFWDPLKKINIKTFQSLNKPIKSSKGKQALKTINLDRQVYSRLLVVPTVTLI